MLKRTENSGNGNSRWECLCECGNKHITTGSRLNQNKVMSCGCIQKEAAKNARTKHGLSTHPLYAVRKEMLARTTNPINSHYQYYGVRGIIVCEEWANKEIGMSSFYKWAIKNGYEKGLSIDRIDNNGNYEPSNCRWATDDVQANNKSVNRLVTYNGKKQTLKQWSVELGMKYRLLQDRLKWGWSVEEAFTKPVRQINKN